MYVFLCRLISILTSCLATLRHYCPPLGPMIMEGVCTLSPSHPPSYHPSLLPLQGVDLAEYPPLFTLSLSPPTIQLTTPPSLATLTTCLSTGVDFLNKVRMSIFNPIPTQLLTMLTPSAGPPSGRDPLPLPREEPVHRPLAGQPPEEGGVPVLPGAGCGGVAGADYTIPCGPSHSTTGQTPAQERAG